MDNREYAETVAKMMGWVYLPKDFDPATDGTSAWQWITAMLAGGLSQEVVAPHPWDTNRLYEWHIGGFTGTGATPLLALKAASEMYFVRQKGEGL